MSGEIKCPKCGSIQLTANKKGYSLKKGLVGMALTGGVGLLGGLFGSNKVEITCLSCGNTFNPGDGEIANNTTNNDTKEAINLFPELKPNENDVDISDIILADYKKDALLSEFDEDYVRAADSWRVYLHDMMENNKECDLKSIDKAIACYQKTNNVISEFFLYEDLISNYPNHQNIDIWKKSKEKLEPKMFSK